MNELLKLDDKGNQAVSARELHAALGMGRDFSTWIKDRVEKYGFVEGRDYSPIVADRSENLIVPKSGENQVEKNGWGGKRDGAGRP